jgi:choline dehydrogenase-like flavoprotein
MQELFDVIVIGSGPAGTHAAAVLVEHGHSVCMLDGGMSEPAILTSGPSRTFEDIRRTDADQWKLLLGEDCSNIPVSGLAGGIGGGMAGGNRSFVTRGTAENLPTTVEHGVVTQSLAKGGLGAVWGGTCAFLGNPDLTAMGLPAEETQRYYDKVTERIGISGPQTRPGVQPPMPPDHHAESMLESAEKNRETLARLNVTVRQPHAAVLTQDLGDRKATELTDMEYYADANKSVYRPQYTIDGLMQKPNFRYSPSVIVQRIEETLEESVVFGHAVGEPSNILRWRGKRVIVAAGAVNTARILLCSYGLYDTPIPFVGKPHVYAACIDRAALGKKGPERRTALCQLIVTDENRTSAHLEGACAQIYSYRSLLLFRLLGSVPFFPLPEALGLLSLFAPSLVLADIRFPGMPTDGHTLTLKRDHLHIACHPGRTPEQLESLKRIKSALKAAGLWVARVVDMPEASTSHHAGTVPVSDDPALPLSCTADGHVKRSRHIYVADASMFRCLPALPHTLTIMANAERVAESVGASLI